MMPKRTSTVRAAVTEINKIIQESSDAIFVVPDQTRIISASDDDGKLCVLGMFNHQSITLTPEQQLGVWRGATCIVSYQWTGNDAVEIDKDYVEAAKVSQAEKPPAAHHPECSCIWCR